MAESVYDVVPEVAGLRLVTGGEVQRLDEQSGRLAFAEYRLRGCSHLQGEDAPLYSTRWPRIIRVESGLRRYTGPVAAAAHLLLKAQRARQDGERAREASQAALRESRRTLERAERERRRALRWWRLAWKAVLASAVVTGGNAVWGVLNALESRSRPLAALALACAFTAVVMTISRPAARAEFGWPTRPDTEE